MKSVTVIKQIVRPKEDGHSLRKIAAASSISKNTVRKYLRNAAESNTEPSNKVSTLAEDLEIDSILAEVAKDVTKNVFMRFTT